MVSGFNTAEGVTIEAVPTTANTGGDSGTAASSVAIAAGDAINVKAAAAMHGSRGYRMAVAAAGAGATRILWPIVDAARDVFSFYFKIDTAVAATEDVGGLRHSAGNMCVLTIGSDGKLVLNNAAGAAVAASKAAATFPVDTWCRIDIAALKGTGTADGYLGYAYFLGDSDTPIFTWESSVQNAGTANMATGFIGRSTGRTVARLLDYDTIRWATQSSGFMTHYVPAGPPVPVPLGQNTAEAIPLGATPSPSNSGGQSGTALSTVTVAAGDSITVSSFNTVHGGRGFAFDLLAGGAGATRLMWALDRGDRVVFSTYLGEIDALPTALEDLMGIRHASGNMGLLAIAADGKLQMLDAGGAGLAASKSTNTIPVQTKIRLDMSVRKGTTTTDGLLGYALFIGNSSTPAFSWESSSVNAGTANAANVFLGRSTGRAQAHKLYFDTVRWAALSSGWLDPYVPAAAAPIASLGPDVIAIEPYSTVELSGLASTDSDNAITAYTFTQTAGPAVTLAGTGPVRTYKAPGTLAGASLTFRLVCTDATSLTSDPVFVTHTVLAVNELAVIGGALVPMEFLQVRI